MTAAPFSVRYQPVGRCIYCGATNDLTREHIIPRGLKGPLLLPEASCRPCAKITGNFEQIVLREGLGMFRRKIGIKPSKKKDQVSQMPLRVSGLDGADEIRVLPMAELPTAFAMPVFHLPDLLVDSPPQFSLNVWTWIKRDAARAPPSAAGFTVGQIDLGAFMRMLAKIAHAYLVSQRGLGTFKPLLMELILSGGEDSHKWVGGLPMEPAVPNLHTIAAGEIVRGDATYYFVDIRLFAQIGAPTYRVVAGKACAASSTG